LSCLGKAGENEQKPKGKKQFSSFSCKSTLLIYGLLDINIVRIIKFKIRRTNEKLIGWKKKINNFFFAFYDAKYLWRVLVADEHVT